MTPSSPDPSLRAHQARGCLLLLILLLLLPTAGAHAVLQASDPPPNGHADVGLSVVEFTFSENVERSYTSANVLNTQGESLADGPVAFDASHANIIRLSVTPLEDGIYEATWKALSIDTHTTRGTFVFAVGNATLAPNQYPARVETQDNAAVTRDGFTRFAFFTGLFLTLGLPVFAIVVMRAARSPADADTPQGLFATAAMFGFVGVAGAAVGLLYLAQRTDLGIAALDTGPGRSLAMRGILLALAAVACAWAALRPSMWRKAAGAAIAFGIASVIATSTGSHAAAVREMTWLYVGADALHLFMGAVWVGGVVGFLHVGWGRTPGEFVAMLLRFSPIAVASVVLLLATGTMASLAHMPCASQGASACISALRSERYMQLVAFKVLLMVPLIFIGAYNKFRIGPALERGIGGVSRFRRVLQVEAVIMALVLLAAGVLAATAPPAADADPGSYTPPYLELSNSTKTNHIILTVSPNPVTVGVQKIIVAVHPLEGRLENSTFVALKVWSADEREPEVTLEPVKVTPNEWELTDGFFTHAGEWHVSVLVQRKTFERVTFNVTVALPGGAASS